jgi:DNA-binding transcriptional LysR family regulator
MDIRQIDLNLLLVFDRLMETRSVTGAARAMGVRQSSVSAALNRLRALTGDRLIERAGNQMIPTQTAVLIWPDIRAALASIETGLGRIPAFDPATEEATFRIGFDEYSAITIGAALAASVRGAAPRCRIEMLPIPPPLADIELSQGRLDISVGASWAPLPGIRIEHLFAEEFVCLVDGHSRAAAGALSLDDYISFPHLLVSSIGRVAGNVDAALAERQLERRVSVTIPFLLAAPQMILGSDMILNVGRRLAATFASWYPVRVLEPPLPIPGFSVVAAWHPRNTEGAAHRWLRDQIAAVAASPGADPGLAAEQILTPAPRSPRASS